jgi:hypothetical protein
MILHRDGLIELRYDAATDILSVRWPDSRNASKAELQFSIAKLIDTLRHYDIKKLFIDASENVENVSDEEYREMNQKFAEDLVSSTHLQKIARIGAPNAIRQKIVEDIAGAELEKRQSKLSFREFGDEQSALEWLQQD